jgi:hypothetical protein
VQVVGDGIGGSEGIFPAVARGAFELSVDATRPPAEVVNLAANLLLPGT